LHILRDLRALSTVYGLSLAAWVLQLAVLEMVTRSLHQPLNLRILVLLILLSNAGTLLPFAPGNLGTFQALTMTTLALFHVRPEVSFSIALAYQMMQFLPVRSSACSTSGRRGSRSRRRGTRAPMKRESARGSGRPADRRGV
jgi:uncharacterized membrane protein YbhN (UPF0104 family)